MAEPADENTQTHSAGIIGGADGLTVMIRADSEAQEKRRREWERLLDLCALQAVPAVRKVTGDEIVQYLKDTYDAYEIEVSEGTMYGLKINAIQALHLAEPQSMPESEDPEVLSAWAQASHKKLRDAALRIPDAQYGFRYVSLRIPRNEKTERFYQERTRELRRYPYTGRGLLSRLRWLISRRHAEDALHEMLYSAELHTRTSQLSGGTASLMDELTVWCGVTLDDIDRRTPEFMSYAAALRDLGKLTLA